MLTPKPLRTQAFACAAVKTELDLLSDGYALLDEFMKARAAQDLTQAQVAQKSGTSNRAAYTPIA
ncbi:hypothetical protein [Rhodoferax sp. WC2427]|uniref:hypothetical protein n=1 Tax=Rhodoferax sp. WC2427 TaxID=3234144 RepID=UPI00346728B0